MVNNKSQGEGTFLKPKWKRPKGKVCPDKNMKKRRAF